MFNNEIAESKDSLPEWNTTSVNKSLVTRDCSIGQVLMDHYVIFVAYEEGPDKSSIFGKQKSGTKEPKLLAFDLRDESIQEFKLDPSMFLESLKGFTFIKYKDNQIIMFGGWRKDKDLTFGATIRITIESFKPFTAKCEEIKINGKQPVLLRHTAQIYNNHLYVYGGNDNLYGYNTKPDLWSFDLDTFTPKLCQSSGEKPELKQMSSSFIDQDNLYIYGGLGDSANTTNIFRLNLSSMIWKRLEQTESFSMNKVKNHYDDHEIKSTLYKGYLLILREKKHVHIREDGNLCCWNIHTNYWSKFTIQRCPVQLSSTNIFVLNDMLIVSGVAYNNQNPTISTLDLNCIQGFTIPESSEEKSLKSLFMSEEESDIKLKIHDKIIPAHKQILVQKSKYFANLFNSGMVESTQSIIDITDPDYDFNIFQEFLRFLYYGEAKLDQNLAFKLIPFTDKYLQEDLSFKCTDYLRQNLSLENAYTILDFARDENIDHLRKWCVNFLKTKVDLKTIFDLTEYLNKQNNPEFAQENLELRDKALTIITQNYFEISKDPKQPRYYEDFLIKNIAEGTISALLSFVYGANYKIEREKNSVTNSRLFGGLATIENNSNGIGLFASTNKNEGLFGSPSKNDPQRNDPEKEKNERDRLKPEITNLKPALFEFIQDNMEALKESDVASEFTKEFLMDLVLFVKERADHYKKQLHGEQQQTSQ